MSNSLVFPLSHWKRETISTGLNSLQYQLHGIYNALLVLEHSGFTPNGAKSSSVLDFGCGTGKVSRVLSFIFGNVVGYDPAHSCITAALTECKPWATCPMDNLTYVDRLPQDALFDCICSINVVEHLGDSGAVQAFSEMEALLRPGGVLVIWVSGAKNPTLTARLGKSGMDHHIATWRKPLVK